MPSSPKISVIIPCYNQGKYLGECLHSVLNQTYANYEIIVVNDGSTDEFTNKFITQLNKPKTITYTTQNQGLAATRNYAIKKCTGDYILPLDADDKIGPAYLEKAMECFSKSTTIGIVYCKAQYFGYKKGPWNLPTFSLDTMVLGNIIFCSAIFKKIDWESVGGYDPGMIYGWEDYEFWIGLLEKGCHVHQIQETLFYYRTHKKTSMINKMKREHQLFSHKRIMKRHMPFYSANIAILINHINKLERGGKTFQYYIDLRNYFKNKLKNKNIVFKIKVWFGLLCRLQMMKALKKLVK